MFRFLCDPSSGSTELCLTEISRSCSQIFCRVLESVFGSVILNLWRVCTVRPARVIFNFVSFNLLYNVDFNL